MKTLYKWSLRLIGVLAIAGMVYGQQPPCANGVCTSDAYNNTAMGTRALLELADPAGNNTAVGAFSLVYNQNASNNTAVGAFSLAYTQANNNTALGFEALLDNTTGSNNTATGFYALAGNYPSTGSYNSAAGAEALYSNTTGGYNTASGYQALYSNTGGENTASGFKALAANTTGEQNTATGLRALFSNTSGNLNIAEGYDAGYYLTTGSNNIDIGSPGAAGDNATIKIGVQGTQTATFIAGIYDHSLTGSQVVVTSTGELGVVASSERFKTAIAPMGSNTAQLGELRPVTFQLKSDATGTRQYGLIAEEVAKVYPELVIRDEKGRIDGVRYDELAPMLLNEVQKQAAEIRAQAEQLRDVQQQLVELHAALAKLQSKDELVAQR
jgi:hypothetical protein